MKTNPKFDFEKATFIAAAEALSIARSYGAEISGADAVFAVETMRVPNMFRQSREELSPEVEEYYQVLGKYVELAAELEPSVDPKV